ncbi:hypothetical protein ABPG72_018733 [Tetrahymena utriculariae]
MNSSGNGQLKSSSTNKTKGQNEVKILAAFKQQIVVDSEQGPIKTIQQAIDESLPGCVIKIAPGLYQECLKINKPQLRLEAKDKSGDVVILGNKGPVILLNVQKSEKCHLVGLKIAHTGQVEDEKDEGYKKSHFTKTLNVNNQELIERDINSDIITYVSPPEKELCDVYNINQYVHSIVTVYSGKIFIEDSLLSLNFIAYTFKQILPAILVSENGELILNRTEIKGHKNQDTIGILIQNGDALIKDSKIHNHKSGGIYIKSKPTNHVKIINTKIVQNEIIGVLCQGIDSQVLLEGNKIEKNGGPGIRIGISNKSCIIRNEIRLNRPGIEVVSGDPYIYENRIDKNISSGIVTVAYSDYRCDGRIKSNISISGNRDFGVVCSGIKNHTKIESNTCISYNKKSGIRAEDNSEIYLFKNKISRNMGQGVLVVETASAVVEKNEIYENMKANIALGGGNSVNTLIVENKIFGGRCEGIFIIDGENTWILRNHIYENNDGIISVTSIPLIQSNEIYRNKSHGIMMVKDSRVNFLNNKVYENDSGVGIFVRDKCQGTIKDNEAYNNKVDILVENRTKSLASVRQENKFSGLVRIPQNYDFSFILDQNSGFCQIF